MFSKKLILSIIFFIVSFVVFSQIKFKGGLTAGINASQIEGDGYRGFDKVGLIGGFVLRSNLNEKWYLQSEIIYIQKGSRDPVNFEIGKYNSAKIALDYVEVPFLIGYKLKDDIPVDIGLSYANLVKVYTEVNGVATPTVNTPIQKSEIGFKMGIGYEFSNNFTLYGRYTTSVTSIGQSVPNDPYLFGTGMYNLGFSFTANYIIPFSK